MDVLENTFIHDLLRKIKQQELEDSQLISLCAYENQMSHTARSMLSSRLADRYSLGTPNEHKYAEIVSVADFVFKGLKHIYDIEKLAVSASSSMFHSVYSEFRLLSGIHGMISSLVALTEVGDTIYSIDYDKGGHFATHFIVNRMGRIPCAIPVDPKTFSFDFDQLSKQIADKPAKMIYLDMGCPLFPIPIQKIRELVGPETIIIYDASHTLGLIAGGKFQDPLNEGADILQGNTHKTFPGPQKAMINFKSMDYVEKLSGSLNYGLVSNRHNHHDLALFITIFEMRKFGKAYAEQMLLNAQSLANSLKENGINVLEQNGEYTKSHILLIEGDSVGGYMEACQKLIQCNISANSRHGFGVEVIRIGVQEVTRRGMKEDDMKTIASFFKMIFKDKEPLEKIKKEVIDFNNQFNSIAFSFDDVV